MGPDGWEGRSGTDALREEKGGSSCSPPHRTWSHGATRPLPWVKPAGCGVWALTLPCPLSSKFAWILKRQEEESTRG